MISEKELDEIENKKIEVLLTPTRIEINKASRENEMLNLLLELEVI